MKMQSDTIIEISKALSKAQSQFLPVLKTAQAYAYKYAPLDVCYECTRDALFKNDLIIIQTADYKGCDGKQILVTSLIHTASGEFFKSALDLDRGQFKGLNSLQEFGATLTYLRRYGYCTILGIIGEEDTDGPVHNYKVNNANNDQNKSLAKLLSMLKDKNIDAGTFAKKYNISSKNITSIEDAIKNFDHYVENFNSVTVQ